MYSGVQGLGYLFKSLNRDNYQFKVGRAKGALGGP